MGQIEDLKTYELNLNITPNTEKLKTFRSPKYDKVLYLLTNNTGHKRLDAQLMVLLSTQLRS